MTSGKFKAKAAKGGYSSSPEEQSWSHEKLCRQRMRTTTLDFQEAHNTRGVREVEPKGIKWGTCHSEQN